jgi:hypothetical protein
MASGRGCPNGLLFLKVIGEQAALHLGSIFNVPEGFVALG